jgi:uncharacterized protein (UPF0332 family)
MNRQEQSALINYRIKRAANSLRDAQNLFNTNSYESSVNRLYYACFYAAGALLATKNIQVKSHAGVKQMLGEHFIKTEIIDKEQGKFYSVIFSYRQDSDYLDFAEVSKEFTEELINQSQKLINTLTEYLIQNDYYKQPD